jgi:hypothetical protein
MNIYKILKKYLKKEKILFKKNELKDIVNKMNENTIILNHSYKENKKTFYEYDKDFWEKNKEAGLNQDTHKILFSQGEFFISLKKDYFLNKLFIEEGKIISLHWYAINFIYEELNKFINNKYPNIEVKSKIKAFGKEDKLKEKKERLNKNFYFIGEILIKELKFYENYTFIKEKEESYDINNYIIGGIEISKKIKLNNFIKDFEEFLQPYKVLERKLLKIKKRIIKDLKI